MISTALPHRNREGYASYFSLGSADGSTHAMYDYCLRVAAHAKEDLCNSSDVLENLCREHSTCLVEE